MGGLDAKIFGIKDVIYILVIAGGLFANWYTMDGRVGSLEANDSSQEKSILKLEKKNEAYVSLPKDVEKLTEDVKDNAKLTKAIYLGLVAKGIIKPPQ